MKGFMFELHVNNWFENRNTCTYRHPTGNPLISGYRVQMTGYGYTVFSIKHMIDARVVGIAFCVTKS